MGAIRFDTEQRFTCRQCARCCRRGWDIILSAGEVKTYQEVGASRWYREEPQCAEESEHDVFETVPGHPSLYRIRKRSDGVCGFLSSEDRCRLHEEMGAGRKPLSCRLFPYRIHVGEAVPIITASFSCPTVIANSGATLASQSRELVVLKREWLREYPAKKGELVFVSNHPISSAALERLRRILRSLLDRPGPSGAPDLSSNATRMAKLLEDLSRYRVLRLSPEAFLDYLDVVGRHAATSEKPAILRRPSALGRLLFRGFLFLVVAARLQSRETSGLRLRLRLRLLRLLAHVHSLGPADEGLDLRAARRVRVDLEDPSVRSLTHNYLRASIETLGTGRWGVLDELAISVSQLNAAFALAAARAATKQRAVVDSSDLTEGLLEASDLSHAESGRLLKSVTATLAGGVDALYLLAEPPGLGRP